MATSTTKKEAEKKVKRRPQRRQPTVRAPRAEEAEVKEFRYRTKHIWYTGGAIIVIGCSVTYFAVSLKHKLSMSRAEAIAGAIAEQIPATIYASAHAYATVASNPMQGAAMGPPPPAPPSPAFHQSASQHLNMPKSKKRRVVDANDLIESVEESLALSKEDLLEGLDDLGDWWDQEHKITYTDRSLSQIPEVVALAAQETGKTVLGISDIRESRRRRRYDDRRSGLVEGVSVVNALLSFSRLFRAL